MPFRYARRCRGSTPHPHAPLQNSPTHPCWADGWPGWPVARSRKFRWPVRRSAAPPFCEALQSAESMTRASAATRMGTHHQLVGLGRQLRRGREENGGGRRNWAGQGTTRGVCPPSARVRPTKNAGGLPRSERETVLRGACRGRRALSRRLKGVSLPEPSPGCTG